MRIGEQVCAHGDDELLWAFRRLFKDELNLPADGSVLGEPVSVTARDYDGNARRGPTDTCEVIYSMLIARYPTGRLSSVR